MLPFYLTFCAPIVIIALIIILDVREYRRKGFVSTTPKEDSWLVTAGKAVKAVKEECVKAKKNVDWPTARVVRK